MRARFAAKALPALFFLLPTCCRITAQQPANCIHIFFCLFNQEAAASDPAGIQKYSRDVVDLILPNAWTYGRSPSGRMEEFENEFLGEKYAAKLADRLAQTEQTARTGTGKLVPISDVVRAFNDLMKEVGAPSSVRTDERSLQSFREHAAAIKAFPALFSADRNGTKCNPGEAVFLIGLLISDNGLLHEGNLDSALELMQPRDQRNEGRSGGFAVGGIDRAPDAQRLVSSYPKDHGRSAGIKLFDHVADILGF
jgi:hypothetical protein